MAMDRNQEPAEFNNAAIFNRLFWALKRYAGVILVCFAFGLLLSYLFISYVPPKYKASVQLLFDPSMEQFVQSEPNFLPGIATAKALERAIALIQSPAILKQVALKLMEQPVQHDSELKTAIQSILSDTAASADARLRRLILRLQKSLAITTEAVDQIIIVSYQSERPREAADLANLIASTFVDDRTATRKAVLSQATGWLDQRASETKSKLIEIDKKIQSYKAEHKLEGDAGTSEYDGQLAQLRGQLALVEAKLSNAESLYNALRPYSNADHYDYGKLAETLNDPALEKLRAALTELEGQSAAAKIRLGSFHPEVKAKEIQAQVIRQEIEAEARRKLETAAKELEALRYEQRELSAKAEAIRLKVTGLRAAEVQLHELQREREAVKTLYDSTLARLTQTAPQQTLSLSEFKVLIDAAVPERPKIPPILMWIVGGAFGIGLGLVLTLLLDFLNDRLVHLDAVEQTLPLPLIARVPIIRERDFLDARAGGEDRASGYLHFAQEYPQSLFTNCLMNAKIVLSGAHEEGANSIIMITSPVQGDGKTHISSNLASLSALLGERTLLIDLDSRKQPAHSRGMNGAAVSRISEFLDAANLGSLLKATCEAGFDIVRPRSSEGMAWLKFHTPQMRELLDFARAEYKQVWIDTPPVQLFADALTLAGRVDGVIIVAEWSKTTRRQVLRTRDLILQSGGRVLGLIINKVKVDTLISPSMAYYQSYYKSQAKPKMFKTFL